MDRLVCVGVSYRTAPVEIRERVDLLAAIARLGDAVSEHACLRTCYRVELYAVLDAGVGDPRDAFLGAVSDELQLDREALLDHLVVRVGEGAVRHLCRVATGLDSLVLGESEVLGQVGGAFEESVAARTAGSTLELLFRTVISAGRRARSVTAINTNPATASSMALSLAERSLGTLAGKHTLVIGGGRVGLQAVKTLERKGLRMAVASRTRERASQIAARYEVPAYDLDDLEVAVSTADVVIAATRAEHPILTEATVRQAMSMRAERPLVIVDLAVPADVERTTASVPGVRLFDVDDLRAGLDEARASRLAEVPKVEAIIEEEILAFGRRHRELQVAPILAALRQQAESLRRRELDRALDELGDVDPRVADRMEHLTRTLVTRLLHDPTVRLRQLAVAGEGERVGSVFQELFGIGNPRDS